MQTENEYQPLIFLTEKLWFPPHEEANEEGLLAIGGDLSPERLVLAYKNGIFPWFNEASPILWWSPAKRMVLFPDKIKISKSMRKLVREGKFHITKNKCFEKVMDYCARTKRDGQEGTWITSAMIGAYTRLHQNGLAESYEVWDGGRLVGGLYGINLGHVFCGESMFSLVSNASKFALIKLAQELHQKGYELIDCQLYTQHLERMGAQEIPRDEFIAILKGSNT